MVPRDMDHFLKQGEFPVGIDDRVFGTSLELAEDIKECFESQIVNSVNLEGSKSRRAIPTGSSGLFPRLGCSEDLCNRSETIALPKVVRLIPSCQCSVGKQPNSSTRSYQRTEHSDP